MQSFLLLLIHFLCTLAKLLRSGGSRNVVAENLALKQQLLILKRRNKRSPRLTTFDRFFYGLITFFTGKHHIHQFAIILKPATILKFHKALVDRKYKKLFSKKPHNKLGRKAPDQKIIDLVIEMKKRNPTYGYGRIAMQIFESLGIEISRFTVGRILRKNRNQFPSGDGPSWLSFLGNMKDSLWSVDLFRCESITLKSHWVMVVMDQFSRRIIGFAVHAGDCDGITYCRMFNSILAENSPPKYLSTDNDPLFKFHRWQANLRVIDVEEIKSIPYVPTSHPFVERLIGTVRRECTDHTLFFNSTDLQKKLDGFKDYYNQTRAHSSLNCKTPFDSLSESITTKIPYLPKNTRWKSFSNGMYQLPVSV